jgi:hypothetical protein
MSADDMDEAIQILKETRAELRALRADARERLGPSTPQLGGRTDSRETVQAILRSTWADLLALAEVAGKPPRPR